MKKRSRKTNLAQELALLVVSLEIIKLVIEILSKVVNYDRTLRQCRLYIQPT